MSDLLTAFEEYLSVTKALDTLTVSSYINDLKQLETFSEKTLTKLETADVLKFLATFENKRTLNRKLSAINTFFTFVICKILVMRRSRYLCPRYLRIYQNTLVVKRY